MRKHVILLGGKISSGKNTAFDAIVKLYKNKIVERQYFAKGVKDIAAEAFQRYAIHLNKSVYEVIDILSFSHTSDDPIIQKLKTLTIKPENWYEDKTESTRILLQTLGTDIIRNHVDTEFWVNRTSEQIMSSNADVFVLTDFRFENEYHTLADNLVRDMDHEYEIICLNLIRSIDRNNQTIHSHESENALNYFAHWNATITNDGSLEDLSEQLSTVLDGYIYGNITD